MVYAFQKPSDSLFERLSKGVNSYSEAPLRPRTTLGAERAYTILHAPRALAGVGDGWWVRLKLARFCSLAGTCGVASPRLIEVSRGTHRAAICRVSSQPGLFTGGPGLLSAAIVSLGSVHSSTPPQRAALGSRRLGRYTLLACTLHPHPSSLHYSPSLEKFNPVRKPSSVKCIQYANPNHIMHTCSERL